MLLDKKTTKQLKFEIKPEKKYRKVFKKIILTKEQLKLYKKNSKMYNTLMEELKRLRSIKNNSYSRLYYESPKHNVKTFVLVDKNGKPTSFGNWAEARNWAKRRLQTKIREQRSAYKTLKTDSRQFKSLYYELSGGVHKEKNTILNFCKSYKKEALRMFKSPNEFDDYIGIEVEFIGPEDKNRLENLLCKYNLHENAYITWDSSIEWDEDELEFGEYAAGWELNILSKQSEVFDVIESLGKVLWSFEAQVNETCGLHVHLDMRNKDHKKIFTNMARLEKMFYKLVKDDRVDNTYCQRLDGDNWDNETPAKYRWLNAKDSFLNRNTFEVRLHHGTINADEISNWVKLLLRVYKFKGTIRNKLEKLSELDKICNIEKDVLEYYEWSA